MQKNKFTRYHILAWVAYFVYTSIGAYILPSTPLEKNYSFHIIVLEVDYTLCQIMSFYYLYSLILPGLASKKNLYIYIIGLILVPLIFVFSRYLLEQVLDPAVFGFRNYGVNTTYSYYLFDNIYRSLPVVFISIAVWSLERTYNHEQEIKQLRDEKTMAELAFLKSQVNPHFLYNTLNYIYSLAYPVSDKLADAVIKLSKMMRYMLHDSVENKVELQNEIDYLNNYIALYQLRFKDKFYVHFDYSIAEASLKIASLVMIPFVENAFKHGIVNDPNDPIKIAMKTQNNKLTFTVSNKINHYQKDTSSGIGLSNVRKRLDLLYPNRYEMLVANNGLTYKITLIILL